jgi:hypothetical protein
MATGTSPSIAWLGSDNYEVAYHATNGDVSTYTPSTGVSEFGVPMMAGTNPSIIGLSTGGAEVALQASTGWLWMIGPSGQDNTHLGMNPRSSPSVAALPGGSYEAAFQNYVPPPPSTGTTPIDPPRPPHSKHRKHRLRAMVSLSWQWHGPVTELTRLRLLRLPHHARVTITCDGHGCPRSRASASAAHLATLRRHLLGRRFHARDRIFVRISAHGELPELAEFVIRDGRRPSAQLVKP